MSIRTRAVLTAVLLLAACGPQGAAKDPDTHSPGQAGYTQGQLVVAVPHMPDPRFAQSVIYMVEHDSRGAFGLIVNRPVGVGSMGKFLQGFGLPAPDDAGDVLLHYGGPVDPGRLFVLHSRDWDSSNTLILGGPLAVTTHPDVLKALAAGNGPRRSLVILGYAGWGPGQLEYEISRGDWVSAPADPDIIFDDDATTKWERASAVAGISL